MFGKKISWSTSSRATVTLSWIFDNKIKFPIEISVEVSWGEGVTPFINEEKKKQIRVRNHLIKFI